MKVFIVIALIALVALAGVEAGRGHQGGRHGHDNRIRASSKTIVTQANGLHRFCIPIGKKAANIESLSLHVPRSPLGFQVKLDTFPTTTFSSPLSHLDNGCKKTSSLFLVKDKTPAASFSYATSEIVKDGAIAGFIYGARPEWISVQMKGDGITSVDHADDVCRSILGRKSESAFEHREDKKEGDSHKSRVGLWITRFIFSRATLLGFAGLAVFVIISLTVRTVRKCRAMRAAPANDVELSAVNENQEAQDLAQAIENSLSDQNQKKVVEVPQAHAPHFVFLPPNMPASGAPGAPTAYVPMFAPQFMNYSYEERQD